MMNTFQTNDRLAWRKWLSEHFESESEILFVFPTKSSDEESISYNDAVEEALCFGWIDGVCGKIDDQHTSRRFTPRRNGSSYSRPNIERLIWLEQRGMIHPKVRSTVLPLIKEPYVFPMDILAAIKNDPAAQANFEQFSEPYKRLRIAYIDAARKRPEEFKKRLNNFISKTRENKLIMDYGGVDKYYK